MSAAEHAHPCILIIERDRGVRTMLVRLVTRWGYEALSAESAESGLRLLDGARAVALVLSDFQPMAGEPTVRDFLTRRTGSPAPPFLCTRSSWDSPDDVRCIPRPFDLPALRAAVETLIREG
jgi:DNA-binding response OmpR family regulator